MNFERLLKERKIEKIEREDQDFDKCFSDVKSAKHNFKSEDYEWARTIAYNSVLRAGVRLLASFGYRAIGKEHHKNVFEFLLECKIDEKLTRYFNHLRIKRNEFIYRDIVNASKEETKETIKLANKFVLKIRTFVRKIRTKEGKERSFDKQIEKSNFSFLWQT